MTYIEIHNALKSLSGVCDGATSEDKAGFNSFDSNFGKTLAHAPKLTFGQAKAAYKMLKKYQKQLSTLGVDYSSIPEPKPEQSKEIPEPSLKKADLSSDERIQITFKTEKSEFYELLGKIKEIPGRRFDGKTKTWNAPLSMDSVQALEALNFEISPELKKWYKKEFIRAEHITEQIIDIEFEDEHLFEYQVPHAKQLIESVLRNGAGLDASDTGTGKTYVALAVAKKLGLYPVIITPKTVIPSWRKAAKYFGIPCFVSNYEQYRNGKTNWLTYSQTSDEKDIYNWCTDERHIIIFDEAHRCKNEKTLNSKMMRAVQKTDSKALALSATIADNPLQLYSLGLLIGLFSDHQDFWRWAYTRGVSKGWFGVEFSPTEETFKKLHEDLFPKRGSRIKIKDLGDAFPDNKIICDTYDMNSNASKIQRAYDSMHTELSRLKEAKERDLGSSILVEILRARQEIELLKVPTMVEMAQDLIEEGNSVAVFVNFRQTIEALAEKLKTKCIIDGTVVDTERENNINSFQEDRQRVILCNIKAGGVGISLHDLNGNFPRVSLISPTNSAQDLVQTLGRIHRAGAKSKAVQKLIFCAGTIEEEVAEKVASKMDNIKLINDGDLEDSMSLIIKGDQK
jgi:superfamily II DNA or RNA helicase